MKLAEESLLLMARPVVAGSKAGGLERKLVVIVLRLVP